MREISLVIYFCMFLMSLMSDHQVALKKNQSGIFFGILNYSGSCQTKRSMAYHHISHCRSNGFESEIQWVPKVSVRLRGSVGKTRFSKRSQK
jgi:hypothetical protein